MSKNPKSAGRNSLLAGWILACAAVLPTTGQAQEIGIPYLTNFEPKAENPAIGYQNWATVQDRHGVMYFGNTSGVVEFDGVSWRLLQLPGRSTGRSLATDADGRIYVGGQGTFGRLEATATGQMRYQSLSDRVPTEDRDFRDVWKTHVIGAGVYFQTFSHIFALVEGELRVWKPVTSFHMSFAVNGTLWVRQEGVGLMRLSGGELLLAPGGEVFAEKRIYTMLALDDGTVLIGTRENGFFRYDGEVFDAFATEADDFLLEAQLYHGTVLGDGTIALASLRGGIALMDPRGKLLMVIDREIGLQDPTVTSVFADTRGGLWLTLDRNVTRIEFPSAFTLFSEVTGLVGAVSSVIRFEGSIFAATTQGVYRLVPPGHSRSGATAISTFEPIQEIATQSWDLEAFDELLIAATNDGVFAIHEGRAQKISQVRALAVMRSEAEQSRLVVGMLDGVRSLMRHGDVWEDEGVIGDLEDEVWTLAEDSEGGLWVGGRYTGVHRFTRTDGDEWHDRLLGQEEGLPPARRRTYMYSVHGEVLAATDSGLYRFDTPAQLFRPVTDLGGPFGRSHCWTTLVREGEDDAVWLVAGPESGVGVARRLSDGTTVWDNEAFRGISANTVLEIYPEPGDALWLGTSNGLIRYDPTVERITPPQLHCLIRKVRTLDDKRDIFLGTSSSTTRVHGAETPRLEYVHNDLRFTFAAPLPGAQAGVEYRHILEGFDRSWSEWSQKVSREYTNLPEGRYTFRVMARAPGDLMSTTDSFVVQILPPWHRTWWAATLFMVLSIAALWAFVQLQVRHARRKERLEAENRRRAFELQRARNIQNTMLPSGPPDVPGLQIAAAQHTATEVGGDYYDFFPQPDGRLFAAIGDATGHGLGAGLMVAATRTALLTVREHNLVIVADELNQVLRRVNLGKRLNMALTMLSIQPQASGDGFDVDATGGGMAPVYVLRADGRAEEHLISGVPLGALANPEYTLRTNSLSPGDALILMSDGVHERAHPDAGPFGYDGVMRALTELSASAAAGHATSADDLLAAILEAGERWADGATIEDDVTVVVIRVLNRP